MKDFKIMKNSIRTIEGMEENISRLKELNKYDHEKEDKIRPFSIEFGGGSTHVRDFILSNEEGNKIEAFFIDLWEKRLINAQSALSIEINDQ